MQFAQEGVEALGDGAQFIDSVDIQAAGQVAFALGDVVQHGNHFTQWLGDAIAGQPHGQQATCGNQQANQRHVQRVAALLLIEGVAQGVQFGHYGGQGHLQE